MWRGACEPACVSLGGLLLIMSTIIISSVAVVVVGVVGAVVSGLCSIAEITLLCMAANRAAVI